MMLESESFGVSGEFEASLMSRELDSKLGEKKSEDLSG